MSNTTTLGSYIMQNPFLKQLKLRPTGRLNVQVRHFRDGDGNLYVNLLISNNNN